MHRGHQPTRLVGFCDPLPLLPSLGRTIPFHVLLSKYVFDCCLGPRKVDMRVQRALDLLLMQPPSSSCTLFCTYCLGFVSIPIHSLIKPFRCPLTPRLFNGQGFFLLHRPKGLKALETTTWKIWLKLLARVSTYVVYSVAESVLHSHKVFSMVPWAFFLDSETVATGIRFAYEWLVMPKLSSGSSRRLR